MTVKDFKWQLPESAQAHYVEESAIRDAEIPPDIESAAHILVSERHGKFDLAHLVGYLLTDLAAHEASNRIRGENLETLRAENAKLREALERLVSDAGPVQARGAITGPQWLPFGISLVKARVALGESNGSNPV